MAQDHTNPHQWAVWLSTGFGVGYLPKMPGTYGSVEGALLFVGLDQLFHATRIGDVGTTLAVATLCVASVWVTSLALPNFTSSDPHSIVIDEVAGQAVTLTALLFWPTAWSWHHVLVGFILFRVFDITKPLFIRRLERLHGAWGVVADDVGAGLVGGLILLAWPYVSR
jgi:phosphatidylglycerophosphatase A